MADAESNSDCCECLCLPRDLKVQMQCQLSSFCPSAGGVEIKSMSEPAGGTRSLNGKGFLPSHRGIILRLAMLTLRIWVSFINQEIS
ncbi:hypothetical protein CEXT_263271 [Caerostris extrusa]|uniref:Uncharacterized protein n=1 Tax=Caerostris extrusa TaxID=172846 RepID=A0AAV4TQL4_CAEEX|nr:hypothetical protein CEXT_263271 [Caerostris extrusa]